MNSPYYLTVEWMDLLHYHFHITNYSTCMDTPILQILYAIIYCWYGHKYAYINCSGLDPKINSIYLGSMHVDGMSNDLVSVWYEL